jgi:imidazolonepropionase-like amidohydrolase
MGKKKLPAAIVILAGIASIAASAHVRGQSQPATAPKHETIILNGATIIDGTGRGPVTNRSVAIADGRIVYIGDPAELPSFPRAKTIDLSGHWIVPGFVDMHAHFPDDDEEASIRFFSQLIAFGTTTIRAPSNPNVGLRAKIAKGEVIGPQLFMASRLINGPNSRFGQIAGTEKEMRALVRREAAQRVDFIKLYTGVSNQLTRAAIDEAHSHGLKVIGHLGETTWTEAAEAGIDALTHSWFAGLAHSVVPLEHRREFKGFYIPGPIDPKLFGKWRELVDPNGPEVHALADLLHERNIVVDPNLVHGEAVTWGDDPSALERLEPDFAGDQLAAKWRSGRHPYSASWSGAAMAEAKLAFPKMVEIVGVFHQRRVLLTAGTDYMNPWMTPGVAFHRELELLVSAGIPPQEVLQIATRNGAKALGILEQTGTIEVGKEADLVVLAANPIESISNTRKIKSVFVNGTEYDPAVLMEVAHGEATTPRTGASVP